MVLQWAPAPAQEGRPASPPRRLVVDTLVRHGPLAGARVAGAVADYRFALEGLDDEALAHLGKASAPVLTSVHHLTGSHDVHLRLPAGEAEGGDGVTLRWQEMVYDMAIGRDGRHFQGHFRGPEFGMTGIPDASAQAAAEEEEENDAGETASPEPMDRTSITVQGMEGSFDNVAIRGLWGVGTGKADFRFGRVAMSVLPAAGGDARHTLDLKNAAGTYIIDATDDTLGMTTTLNAAGRIGGIDFESVSMEERIQRISIEAIRPGAQAQDVDAMVAMAQSSGYLLQEGEFLTSAVQLQPGQLILNGKTLPLPSGAAR
ncbi:DUF945 family protein [Paracidovorax citrulli]